MSDLKAYLAAKYMTGVKADAILSQSDLTHSNPDLKRRKKKRKVESASATERSVAAGGGLIIDDDDGMGWAKSNRDQEDEEEDGGGGGGTVVETKRGVFKKKDKSKKSWETIREGEVVPGREDFSGRSPTPEPVDEEPVLVVDTATAKPRGGLQSAADLKRENEKRLAEEEKRKIEIARELARIQKERKEKGEGEEEDDPDDPHATVYRDASGRKIDVKLEKAEQAKRKREEVEREMKKMEWGKGLVQKADKEEQRREAQKSLLKPMARFADDKDLNDDLRDQERWNDPAAAFLTKKKETKSSGPKFPSYRGPAPPPNRFGIPPGYRWDGVDRGNGFEAKLMQRGNSKKMFEAAKHSFLTDDM